MIMSTARVAIALIVTWRGRGHMDRAIGLVNMMLIDPDRRADMGRPVHVPRGSRSSQPEGGQRQGYHEPEGTKRIAHGCTVSWCQQTSQSGSRGI